MLIEKMSRKNHRDAKTMLCTFSQHRATSVCQTRHPCCSKTRLYEHVGYEDKIYDSINQEEGARPLVGWCRQERNSNGEQEQEHQC